MTAASRSDLDPTRRFSDRVEDYVRTRPDYPDAAIDWVLSETGLGEGATVVDLAPARASWRARSSTGG